MRRTRRVTKSGNVTSTRVVLPDSDEEETAERWVKSTARHITIAANASSKSRPTKKTHFTEAEELEAIPSLQSNRVEDTPSIPFDHGAWSETYNVGDFGLSRDHYEYGNDHPDDEDEDEDEDVDFSNVHDIADFVAIMEGDNKKAKRVSIVIVWYGNG